MAAEFYSFLGIQFSNQWLEAILHVAFYIGLYILGRIALKFIKIRVLEKIKGQQIKINIFLGFYKLAKRVLQLASAYYVLISIPLLDKVSGFIYSAFFILGLILVLMAISKIAEFIVLYSLHGNTRHLAPLINRINNIIFFTIGIMVGLRHFDQDIWHIATALGIGSLAVGLAAQPTLTNLIAGFNILIDRPFKVGDRIRLATGDVGDVVDIGLRSTQIRTTDGNMLIAPNSELGNSRVVNFTMPDNGMTNNIKYQFDLDADITKIKLVLGDALRAIDGISQPIEIQLSNVVDGNIELTLSIKASNYTGQGKLIDKVIQESIFAFRRNGIQFAESKFRVSRS